MKRISLQFSALLATLFLFAFSCQDHVVPEDPEVPVTAPTVQTVALSIENQNLNQYRYKLNIQNLGNAQITGYGVVFSAEFNSNAPFTNMPTIANEMVVFPMPISTGEKSKVGAAPPIGYKTIYYRAYVTYGVNSVAYGDVMEFSPEEPKSELAVIEITDLTDTGNDPIGALKISELGNLPIAEFGIAYSYTNSSEQPAPNPLPTKDDNIDIFDIKQLMVIDYLPSELNTSGSPNKCFARSYVKYQNGTIEYGKVVKSF